ncbi:PaaI family thioesterase, partial [Rhodococcus sp. BS-15]|uniref:PaaI family thioesterase n=1 Tax=Rhodococcus sp. BS-15 TaxID=1304954 RepID=UPI0035B55090
MHNLARHWIDNVILQSPVARAIGISLRSAEVDAVTADLPFSEDLTTTPGVIHGGVIASLIDALGAAGSASGVTPEQEATGGATSHLAIS